MDTHHLRSKLVKSTSKSLCIICKRRVLKKVDAGCNVLSVFPKDYVFLIGTVKLRSFFYHTDVLGWKTVSGLRIEHTHTHAHTNMKSGT